MTIDDQWDRFTAGVPAGEAAVLSRCHFEEWGRLYLDTDPESRTRSPASVKTPGGPWHDIAAAWAGDLAAVLGLPEPGTHGLLDRDVFESIYHPGKRLILASWRDGAAAGRWRPRQIPGGALRHRQVRIIRDYGMADRREALQYYPDVSWP